MRKGERWRGHDGRTSDGHVMKRCGQVHLFVVLEIIRCLKIRFNIEASSMELEDLLCLTYTKSGFQARRHAAFDYL